ncbi:MAG: hypothetical protein ASUL_05983 [Candidatus Aramenus sulfurataquae]|uniref:Uncharacterized protein n=1 Tax=Candidatus Aramenus sulfurataquae TaxID=1326980 RepID=W7KUW0_9CREN|nr:MAG: hypothetical protein ASUL_05983 [Candidatus Aramenus sulfurataquae]
MQGKNKEVVLCVKCNRFEGEVNVSGKLLCVQCARDEIVKRVRRELSSTGFLEKNDRVLIAYPTFYGNVAALIKDIVSRICKGCNLTIDEVKVEPKGDINETLWTLFKEVFDLNYKKVILPLTADFFLSYLIYSISSLNHGFLSYYDLVTEFRGVKFFIPLFSTPLQELKGFSEITGELNTKDEVLDEILKWSHKEFQDNEIFHTFVNSLTIFSGKRCKICGAYVRPNEEYCQYCLRLSSQKR